MTDEMNDPSAPSGGEGGETAALPDPMGAPGATGGDEVSGDGRSRMESRQAEWMRQLQVMIDEQGDVGFKRSQEGREIISRIRTENQTIERKMRQSFNSARQQRTIADAYEGKSYVGSHMDQKR
jgi:hypothetical protein